MEAFRASLGQPPLLYTPRCVLRRPVAADIASIVAIAGDWQVASRLARVPHPYSEDDARFFLGTIVPAEQTWAIAHRASAEMLGVIGLVPHGEVRDGAEERVALGYYIARGHWGHGIATEAAAVVTAYGVGLVGRHRLVATPFADNYASVRVLEKLGFLRLGVTEEVCLATGAIKPALIMGFGAMVIAGSAG